jgi:alanine racemase
MKRSTIVATILVDSADGFRSTPNRWKTVLIHGQEPILGHVYIDCCLVDIAHLPQTCIGDEVVLLGRQGTSRLTVEEIARRLDTIPYEVIAQLPTRTPRVYHGSIY